MKNLGPFPRARTGLAIVLAAILVSCGGGGDGGGLGPIDLTASNRDAVAHASAAVALAMSPAGAIPLAASAQVATDRRPLAAGTRWRALAMSGPVTEPCSVSGSVSVTLDDRDNNGAISPGDVLTLVFSNCRESPDEVMNGTAAATYTQVSQFPTVTVGARMTMTQLSMAEAQHSVRLDGTVLVDFRQTGASTQTTRLTAEGNVTAAVTTHVFSDTVTMRHGFWFESAFDSSALPPGGGVPGRSTGTMQGDAESMAVGGVLSLVATTNAPLIGYDVDLYPRSGVARVTSRKGVLLLTALSADQVRIDLDADENGAFESSTTVSWDWLL